MQPVKVADSCHQILTAFELSTNRKNALSYRGRRPEVSDGLETDGPELCIAGTDSKQLGELRTCNPGGSDSPKLRTASARSGKTYFDRSWMVSSAISSTVKREIASSRIASSMSRERSSVRRPISTIAEPVAAVGMSLIRRLSESNAAIDIRVQRRIEGERSTFRFGNGRLSDKQLSHPVAP
jgi:hypothetical protein